MSTVDYVKTLNLADKCIKSTCLQDPLSRAMVDGYVVCPALRCMHTRTILHQFLPMLEAQHVLIRFMSHEFDAIAAGCQDRVHQEKAKRRNSETQLGWFEVGPTKLLFFCSLLIEPDRVSGERGAPRTMRRIKMHNTQ